jgi:hypothetical protein
MFLAERSKKQYIAGDHIFEFSKYFAKIDTDNMLVVVKTGHTYNLEGIGFDFMIFVDLENESIALVADKALMKGNSEKLEKTIKCVFPQINIEKTNNLPEWITEDENKIQISLPNGRVTYSKKDGYVYLS